MGELSETDDCGGACGNRNLSAGGNLLWLEMDPAFLGGRWCQRQDLNLRPKAYESPALPLSYSGFFKSQNAGENLRKAKYSPIEFVVTSCLFGFFLERIRRPFRKICSVRLLRRKIAARSSFVDPKAKGRLNQRISDGFPAVGDGEK